MTGTPRPAYDYSELFYNGFKFPPALTSKISSEPVYDDSERRVIYVKHMIDVEFILHHGVDEDYQQTDVYTPVFPRIDVDTEHNILSDFSLKDLRQRLTTPGGHLVINNTGFGGLRTNAAQGTISDAKWGPKPRVVSWDRNVAGRTVKVRWQCEVCIPEEPCAPSPQARLLTHEATQTWDVDQRGMSRRTTTGYLIVRVNRNRTPTRIAGTANPVTGETQDTGTQLQNARQLQITYPRSADEFRPLMNFPPIIGFHRDQNYRQSLDKTRLDYAIVDTEIESQNPFYPGTVEMEAKQRTFTENLFGGVKWVSTIDGVVKIPKGAPMTLAWEAFSKLIAKRKRLMRQNAVVPDTKSKKWLTEANRGQVQPLVFARQFSFEENLFKPEMRFSITFELKCWREFIFKAAGVGKLAFGANETWRAWQESMVGNGVLGVHGVRGLRGLVYDKRSDVLFGLCDNRPNQNDAYQREDRLPREEETTDDSPLKYDAGEITQQNSWLGYRTQVDLIEDTKRIPHYKLEPNEWPSDNKYPSGGTPSPNDQGSQGNYTYKKLAGAGNTPIIQARSTSSHMIAVTGVAERVRYDIAQPVVLSYGGKAAYPVGKLRLKKTHRTDPISGERIVKAMWYQVYQLADKPLEELAAIYDTSTWG